ncbi:MAG: ATP-dependent DNA helicase, partial [Gammaproteobacteria bacterium]
MALACEIAESIEQRQQLLAEAETGTGKTLAYLVPSLRTDARVLISTHTKALQDQLMHRDIPAVVGALGVRRRIALLKGRANYLCPLRLERHLSQGQLKLWEQKSLLAVRTWFEGSRDGDLSGLAFDPFVAGIGAMITATAEQCLGSKCAHVEDCPLMRARKRAQAADIVVTNHSLLLADAALKSGEYGEVLPEFDAYILDEAHALPPLACQHFGVTLTQRRFIQWINDMLAILDELGDEAALRLELQQVFERLLDAWRTGDLEQVEDAWSDIVRLAESRVERGEELARLADRSCQIAEELAIVRAPGEGYVGWQEGEGEARRHIVAPVETGLVLAQHLWHKPAAFVLLSATLRVSQRFDYARRRL